MESGLEKDALIPKNNEQDKKVYDFIQKQKSGDSQIDGGRPQSKQSQMTGPSTFSAMSNSYVRDCDPGPGGKEQANFDHTMRSSFYTTKSGFGQNKQKDNVIASLKSNGILDLTEADRKNIGKIRDYMNEQAKCLDKEADALRDLLMEPDPAELEESSAPPTEKDLKDYTHKLQDTFLKSEDTVRVHKAMEEVPKNRKQFFAAQADPLSELRVPGTTKITKEKISSTF